MVGPTLVEYADSQDKRLETFSKIVASLANNLDKIINTKLYFMMEIVRIVHKAHTYNAVQRV